MSQRPDNEVEKAMSRFGLGFIVRIAEILLRLISWGPLQIREISKSLIVLWLRAIARFVIGVIVRVVWVDVVRLMTTLGLR
jgi:hypothetical protein